jgi:PIN domain nuclease of toxin-antitoxin system
VILLVDANVLVWSLVDPLEIAAAARQAIASPANDVLVSAASVWELGIKQAKGKLRLPEGLATAVESLGFNGLPVTLEDAEVAAALPAHHRDPFDRMLVAQARRLDAVVVTRDRAFGAYDVKVLTA